MSYSVYPTLDFKKAIEKLAKKYPSLKADLLKLTKILKEQPDSGINPGHGIYKISLVGVDFFGEHIGRTER